MKTNDGKTVTNHVWCPRTTEDGKDGKEPTEFGIGHDQ